MAQVTDYLTRKGQTRITSLKIFLRTQLPYGQWTCADGRVVLFDRDYAPICEKYPGTEPVMCDGKQWVKWTSQEWFYDDFTPEHIKRKTGEQILRQWGMMDAVMDDVNKRAVAAPAAICY